MLLHRRIHKFAHGRFDDGVALALKLNRCGRERLGCHSTVYISSLWGGSLPRPRLIVDTEHESLTAMEDYYRQFFALAEVQELLATWKEIEEESWAENYQILSG